MSHIIEQLPRGYVPSKHIIRIEIYLQSHNFNNSYYSTGKTQLKMRFVSLGGSVVIYDKVAGDAFYLLEFSKSYEISNPFLPQDSRYIFG